jgi:hypothetical protein
MELAEVLELGILMTQAFRVACMLNAAHRVL